jgi:predicted outer membrane repeat protein
MSASAALCSRVFRRGLWPACILTFALGALGAHPASAATYTVTDTSDSATDTGSLRYAISQANAGTGGDTINFSGVTGTITVGSTLTILKTVTINGPGASGLAISGGDAVRVFNLGTGAANSVISGLTITHGNATVNGTNQGAGIYTTAALTVNDCTFSYNTAGFGPLNTGGALFGGAQTVTVNGSTFFNNNAVVGDGGAIYSSNLVVNNSTFYNNTAAAEGGAIWVQLGTRLTIRNSTIVGNTSLSTTGGQLGGGGIWVNNPATLTNNIISGNAATAGPDYYCAVGSACGGTITPHPANNLIGDATVTSSLSPLGYNGGPTMTMFPLRSGTGIIGAGLNSTLAADQRAVPRSTTGASDLGAVETYNLVVNTINDSTDPSTTCDGSDTCSLRDALNLANSHGAGDLVTVTGLQGTIALGSPLPDVTSELNILGPGANSFSISGGGVYQVFNITNTNGIANFSGLTIANGSSSSDGGGISNNGSTLTMRNCAFSNNSATGGASGGGLANLNPAGTATVTNCTFSGNNALNGAAAYNLGTLIVENSTFNGNTASGTGSSGGGIFNQGLANVASSTVVGNTADTGGGITNSSPETISVVNSLVAGNRETVSPGDDCSACGTQNAFNLISTTATPISAAQVTVGPLAYNGLNQTVQTMLPLPGSPAIQTGDPTQLVASGLPTDERQLPRTINGKLDLGAVESNYTAIQFVHQPSDALVSQTISPAVTMSVTESGTTISNVPLPITFVGPGTLHGTLTEVTASPAKAGDPALASFGDLSGDTPGTGNTLVSDVTITPASVTPTQTLTATSSPFDIIALPQATLKATINPTTPVYGQPVTITVTVTGTGGVPPTGTVTIYYNGQPIGTGTLGPNGTVVITIPGGGLPIGTDPITVGYSGDSNYGGSMNQPVPVTVTAPAVVADFTVGSTTPTVTVTPGTAAVFTITVGPPNAQPFTSPVKLTVTGIPEGWTNSFSPASVTPGGSTVQSKLSVATYTNLTASTSQRSRFWPYGAIAACLLLPICGVRRFRQMLPRYLLSFLVLSGALGATTVLSGCDGGYFGPPPTSYTLTVTGTSGSLHHSTTVTLKVQ